jgi:hypothetical protein
MATPERLMGVGVNSEVARRTGFFIQTLNAVVATATQNQNFLRGGPANYTFIVSAGATTGWTLDTSFDLGDLIEVCAQGSEVQVFPQTGGRINALATNGAATITTGNVRSFRKVSFAQWYADL